MPKSSPTIVALTLVFLGAMAFAIPEAAIEARTGAKGGYLIGHAQVSSLLAEQKAGEGYAWLAVDLTGATLGKDASFWKGQLNRISERRFRVWGWIDTGAGSARAVELVQGLSLAGLYVYGPDATAMAGMLRAKKPGLTIVPVLRETDPRPVERGYAVAMSKETFPGDGSFVPVLLAGGLGYDAIDAARAKAGDDFLIARISVK